MKNTAKKKAPTNKPLKHAEKKPYSLNAEQRQIVAYQLRQHGLNTSTTLSYLKKCAAKKQSGYTGFSKTTEREVQAFAATKECNEMKFKVTPMSERYMMIVPGVHISGNNVVHGKVAVFVNRTIENGAAKNFTLYASGESCEGSVIRFDADESARILDRSFLGSVFNVISTTRGRYLGNSETHQGDPAADFLGELAADSPDLITTIPPATFMGLPVLSTADLKKMAQEGGADVSKPKTPMGSFSGRVAAQL